MKVNFKSQVIPKHLSVNGIDQIVKLKFIDYEQVFVQVYSISQNFKNLCCATISDGYCMYKCQFRRQAKQLALNHHLLDYSIIKVRVNHCELPESLQFVVIYNFQVLDVDIRKLIGRPITYKQYKVNGYSNSYGSNEIKLDEQTSTIQQIKRNPKGKLLLKGKVTRLPLSTHLGMMFFNIQDQNGDEIEGVSFEQSVIRELQKTIILGRTYIFSNFSVNIKKNNVHQLKFKQSDCVRSASAIKQYSMDQISTEVKFQKKVQNISIQQQKPHNIKRSKIPFQFQQNIFIERQNYKRKQQPQIQRLSVEQIKTSKQNKQKGERQSQIQIFQQRPEIQQKHKIQQKQKANIRNIQQWKKEKIKFEQKDQQKINNKFFKQLFKTPSAWNRFFTITGRIIDQKQDNSYRAIQISDQNSESIDMILWPQINTPIKINGVYRFSHLRAKPHPSGLSYELQSSKYTKIVQTDESQFMQIKQINYFATKQELGIIQKGKQPLAPIQLTKKLPSNPTVISLDQLLQLSEREVSQKSYPLVLCLLKIRLDSLKYNDEGDEKNFFSFYCGDCKQKVRVLMGDNIQCLQCKKGDILVRWNLRVQALDAHHAVKCAINDQALEKLLNLNAKDALQIYINSKPQFQVLMHRMNFQQRVCKFHIKKSERNVFFNILQIYAKYIRFQVQKSMISLEQTLQPIKMV